MNVQVSISADSDGFVSQECPQCRKRFKVVFGEGDGQIQFCCYCGHQELNCWWTQAQADYLSAVGANQLVAPQLEKMARSFNRKSGGGFVGMRMNVKTATVPSPPIEPDEDWPVHVFTCCDERVKHDSSVPSVCCIICGSNETM